MAGMTAVIHRRVLASVLASIGLVFASTACGGGEDSKPKEKTSTPKAAPAAITESDVNALQLDAPRPDVEKRFGKPVDPKGLVPAALRKGEAAGLTCTYYKVKGGASRDLIQLCFKQGQLASKLSLVTPPSK